MPTDLIQLFAWWLLLALAPIVWALSAHSPMRRDERMFRLTFIAAPLVLAMVWLHGVLLDPPPNWERADALRSFLLLFRPHDAAFYSTQLGFLLGAAAPGVLAAAWMVYRGSKCIHWAWNRRTAAISYALQVAGFLLLRHLAGLSLDLAESARWRPLGAVLVEEADRIALAVCVPLPFIIVGLMFARLSVEARARRRGYRAE